MDAERARADTLGHESPINATKQLTDATYHNMADVLFELINQGVCTVMAASHNETTVEYIRQLVHQYDIDPGSNAVYFGQLYGMCDSITCSLSNSGYIAVKCLAYGPVESLVAWLARRAQENGGALKVSSREVDLLKMELKRRLVNFE